MPFVTGWSMKARPCTVIRPLPFRFATVAESVIVWPVVT